MTQRKDGTMQSAATQDLASHPEYQRLQTTVSARLAQKSKASEAAQRASGWFVVLTGPRQEARAQSGLIDRGFATYLPQFHEERTHRRMKNRILVRRVLFPSYLFVLAAAEDCSRIKGADGVTEIIRDVSADNYPLKISHEVVLKLQDRQSRGEFDTVCIPGKPGVARLKSDLLVHIGDRLKITHGPLKDFYAIVERACGGYHVDILVDIFGRPTPVNISLADVRHA